MPMVNGTSGNDTIGAIATNGTGSNQIHIYDPAGNDTINLGFSGITGFSHGHHVRADAADGSARGNDIFNFVNLNQVNATIVGRLEDFDASRDAIQIAGVTLDFNNLPSNVRIVEFMGQHDNPDADPQQWILIDTGGGYIFYALEGARIETDGPGVGANTWEDERHFIDAATLPDFSTLSDVSFVDPQNYVPAGYTAGPGGVVINDIDETLADVAEIITGTGFNDLIAGGLNSDTIQAGNGNDRVWGGSGADSIDGGAGNDSLWGNSGKDILVGGLGDDRLFGGAQNDTLIGGAGGDTLHGGAGVDRASYSNATATVTVNLNTLSHSGDAAGDVFIAIEEFQGSSYDDLFQGAGGADVFILGNGNDTAYGAGGDDRLLGGNGNDRLDGNAGNDTLDGGTGNDVLNGHSGNDRLTGGSGDDTLSGGGGDDLFVFANGFGHDTITDFSVASSTERIQLTAVSGITSFVDLAANHLTQVGGNAVIADGANTITLIGISIASLTASEFVF